MKRTTETKKTAIATISTVIKKQSLRDLANTRNEIILDEVAFPVTDGTLAIFKVDDLHEWAEEKGISFYVDENDNWYYSVDSERSDISFLSRIDALAWIFERTYLKDLIK